MDVGKDGDVRGVAGVSSADRGEGLRARNAERRHHRPNIDLDAHEIGAGGGGDGEHRLGVILEKV